LVLRPWCVAPRLRRMLAAGSGLGLPGRARRPDRATKDQGPGTKLLLLFELDVDDVFGLAGCGAVGSAVGGPASGTGSGSGAGGVEVLGHGLAGALELVDRAVEGRDILTLLGLVDLLDGRLEGRTIGLAELLLVLLEQLLELVDALLGGVAGLGQLAPLLVVS